MLKPDTLWLAREPADMRAGIDTLTQKVRAQLNQSPHGTAAFVFTNKSRTRLKVLLWDRNGVWLCTRRLLRGHFTWPRDGEDAWQVSPQQFAWLTTGVDWLRLTDRPAEKWEE